jgi:hypothetical protein
LYTGDPPTVLTGVMAFAHQESLPVMAINTNGPSLEEVFMVVTGKGMGAARRKHPGAECKGCPVKEVCDSEKEETDNKPKKHHSRFLKGSCEH